MVLVGDGVPLYKGGIAMSGIRGDGNHFGGDWTEEKLDVLEKYLNSYMIALKRQQFEKIYIDGFAGTGYRTPRAVGRKDGESSQALFPDLVELEPQGLLDGSVRRALQMESPFDRYVFIEQDPARCKMLENLRTEFPDMGSRIEIYQSDANEKIRTLCSQSWRSRRAVLFLDPYGMQVEWATLEAVARTRAIDLWLLFPLGIGVGRLLTRSGNIPDQWRRRLDLLLGTEDWYDEFYKVEVQQTLFGEEQETLVKARLDVIGRYFNQRLATIFAGVAPNPGVLRNSTNNPLYLLCFAVANERGKRVALNIAGHLLKGMEQL